MVSKRAGRGNPSLACVYSTVPGPSTVASMVAASLVGAISTEPAPCRPGGTTWNWIARPPLKACR